MNFSYQRRTPATFTTNTTQTKPTTTVAAMESEIDAEALALDEEEEESVTLPVSEFLNLTSMAGMDVDEEQLIGAVNDLNFQ